MMSVVTLFVNQVVQTSLFEWLAVVLAMAYVWLAASQNMWCWLAAFTSTALYTWIFWQVSLPFQSALNLFYMVMAVYGYWQWRAKQSDVAKLVSWRFKRHAGLILAQVLVVVVLASAASTQFDHNYLWLDAAIHVFSVTTTFMVAHKVLQNWLYWIVINCGAAFLYWQSGLVLSSFLFAGYVGFAIYGYRQWKQEWLLANR